MPIPLLHFPYVVQKEIFKSMEYCELFIMSLCSKRMKYCVIRAKRKVHELWYGVNPALKFIALQEGESPVDVIIAFDDQPELSGMKPMELEIGDNFKTRGIAPPDYNLNTGLIIDQLETEGFNPTKRPQWYQIDFK
ncbi:hypothetical protein GCK72_000082 [Caenorhabditis remanei]|uniref:F-box domain-containing protein n=1 Tax=Caenorhabditis remanei TaxID=31234 RepID=A0A6A5HJC1_CAERE|nr:hypothetical protein GCK72_000082 [Caenorhabditis remanei]KAF1768270.1 hypothetical protein GCK72_000082 [Caenorhabditis remanei]